MSGKDIRWLQRFDNLKKAYARFRKALDAHLADPRNDLIQMALVQAFEFTFELSWKTVKDYLAYNGIKKLTLPRDIIKEGFAHRIIEDGQQWIDMMMDRNLMAHTYSEENAQQAVAHIVERYQHGLAQVYEFLRTKQEEV